jgi:probable rRNA maturation factor
MKLAIANRQRTKKINPRLLKQIVGELFTELKLVEVELGIALVGAKEMARVNWDFLQHEGSTDVITFDHSEPADSSQQTAAKVHGELFICVDDAIAQAQKFGTTWQAEVVRYVVHGVLHLLGYDDLKPVLRRAMKRKENWLVRHLGKQFDFLQLSA